jgi:AcrR family transcriptional regulator
MPTAIQPAAAQPTRHRRGRPRRADADAAIIAATLELLDEVGVGRLSMDLIAQRAGVGKATIYRRWDSKEAVVLQALRTATAPIPAPDCGTLREDLDAYYAAIVARYRAARGSDTLPHLIEASCYDPMLRAELDEHQRERQRTMRMLIERAIERGELPESTDVDVVVDVLIGPLVYRRLVTGARIDRDFTRRLMDVVLR